MSNFIDLTGKKFNKLTVIKRSENAPGGIPVWECKCECGNITIVRGNNLKSGAVKSCGCLSKHKKEHKTTDSAVYNTWIKMRNRCNNPNDPAYKDYGKRGIKVCSKWEDFNKFEKWCFENGYQKGMSLDRVNNNKGYSPDNCRFTDAKTQANNRRSCKIYEYKGKTQDLQEWCEELNLNYKRMHNRIYKLNWSFEKAVETPVNENKVSFRFRKE